MWCWTYVVVFAYAVWSERPEDQHAGGREHRHASRRAKVGAQSLQVSSSMALVSTRNRNQTELSADPTDSEVFDEDNSGEPATSNNGNETIVNAEGRQTASATSENTNEMNAEERQTQSASSNDGEKQKTLATQSASQSQTGNDRQKKTEQDKHDENLVETDESKVLDLIKGMDSWEAALIKKFKQNGAGQCVVVKEDNLKYGCAWTPQDRTNMTQKDKNLPACSCGSWFWIEACWHPDADELMSQIQTKNGAKAFEFAKAYLAGMCYTPIWTWVVLGLLIAFLCFCGGWAVRKKGDDLRLVGSTLDPAKARNLGS